MTKIRLVGMNRSVCDHPRPKFGHAHALFFHLGVTLFLENKHNRPFHGRRFDMSQEEKHRYK